MLKLFNPQKLVLLCSLLLLITGCDKCSKKDPFANFNPYDSELPKRIEAYQQIKDPNLSHSQKNISTVYIDFSAGINYAFKNAAIRSKIIDCYNGLISSEQLHAYGLGQGQVNLLQGLDPTSLGQKIDNQSSYADKNAPIQKAVEQIVAKGNDALLITDFEELQNGAEVLTPAFLAPSFSKWLAAGNSIHFFIADYIENKKDKHIYFTIFNRNDGSKNGMLRRLEPILSSLPKYDLTTKFYKLSTKYTTAKSGGIFYGDPENVADNKKFLDLKETYINGLENDRAFEFYPLGVDWKTIEGLREAYKDQFTNFFSKLFIDISNESTYTVGDFSVKVYDVSSDFDYFSKCKEVENHHPKLTKGNANNESKFADDEKDLIAKNCYQSDGSIHKDWIYKPKEISALSDVFILNKKLFDNTRKADQQQVQLGVAFHPNFNVKNISNSEALLRVDIVLDNSTPNITNPILEKFKWIKSSPANSNTALYNSILATLKDKSVNPTDRVIYSYYIKTLQ